MSRFWMAMALVASSAVAQTGDVVFCSDYALSTLKGAYAVDYVVTRKRDNSDLVKVADWAASRARLETQLAAKFPDLGRAFSAYAGLIENRSDYTKPRLWRDAKAREVVVNDKTVLESLTPNCGRQFAGETLIRQVLTRKIVRHGVIHEFDPAYFADMTPALALQYSFLVIGDWLREWSSDEAVVRRVNRFLHSKALEDLSATAGKAAFESMGLSLRRKDFFSVCERTPAVRRLLERVENEDCDRLTELKLGKNYRMDLSESRITALENGDFSGMAVVAALSLRANELTVLPEAVFTGMSALEEIDLAGNRIASIQPETFQRLPKLRLIDLSDNGLQTLSAEAFVGLKLDRLDLTGNRFSEEAKRDFREKTVASIKRVLFD